MSRNPPQTAVARRPARAIPGSVPRVASLACSSPARSYSQPEVLALLGLEGDEFAERIFGRCGVTHRQLELDGDALSMNLQARTALVEDSLFEHATRAIDRTNADLSNVGTLVTATLFSLGGPTLAHRLIEHYEMDPAVDKYHLTGVGCASAVPLFRLAGLALNDDPERTALVVAADLLSGMLSRAAPGDPRSKTVGSAIFGDGCSAAVLASGLDAPGPAIVASTVRHIGGTLDAVRMDLDQFDSHLRLEPDLPEAAAAVLPPLADEFLASIGLACDDVDHWLVHPGGRGILERVQEALALSDHQVRVSRDVLSEHGNMGTPTIFYVLAETIRSCAPKRGDLGLMVTIGPGVTIGLMALAW